MIKEHIATCIQTALKKINADIELTKIQIDATKDKQHGDYASNIALTLAKPLQKKPRDVAELILQNLPASEKIQKVEVAGPGFINFFLTQDALHSIISEILKKGEKFGECNLGQAKKVHVEFVSSNPTGPLHVGHGRHAAFGAVISNLLKTIGYSVHREYYVNDGGRQMDIIAVSVWLRYLLLSGEKFPFPANAYKGEYVVKIAQEILEKFQDKFLIDTSTTFQNLPLDESQGGDKDLYIDAVIEVAKKELANQFDIILDFTVKHIIKDIREDLAEFGVHFDEWFSEKKFIQSDVVDRLIAKLQKLDLVYEKDGALWFRSTSFEDDKDRVLKRSNGQSTYFVNDFAYHVNKFERGFDFAVDVFGSDHHGYIPRMKSGLKAAGIKPDQLNYLLLQFVTLYRGNEQMQMSTRSGSFVTLRDLRKEVGNDAARFFYVMRKAEQHIDFDLELAKSESQENPVYYIQYAHARICSVFRQLHDKNLAYKEDAKNLALLNESHEIKLISTLTRYPSMIVAAANQYEPQILTVYLRDLANDFHAYYNSQQFLVEDTALRNARLTLILAARQVLANGLKLLGVTAPDSM